MVFANQKEAVTRNVMLSSGVRTCLVLFCRLSGGRLPLPLLGLLA